MRERRFRRTTVIAVGLACFLVGLVLARRVQWSNGLAIVIVCSLFSPLLFKRKKLSLLSVSIIGLLLGCWRGTVFIQRLLPYQQLTKKSVTIRAVATSDAVYGDKTQLVFDVGNIQLEKPYKANLVGTIGVKGFGESMIYRGDTVEVSAKLYPTRGARQASLGFAKFTRLQVGTSTIDRLRREFSAGLQSVMPEPLGSFGLGILIGQRTTLPTLLNDQLSAVGLTHIVAVSGYNLTIMVQLAHRLARKRSKYQSTLLTAGLIGMFLLVTGSSASIVRAAIVSMLSLWAWFYGRTFRPVVLILLAAVLTAGWFPPYLWSDIGWHLSFLAFAGVLVVSPLIIKHFFKRKPKVLTQMLVETTAAQILTLPIIMYIFGRLSLIALLANMLVVPLVPMAMGLSFIAGLAGMLLPSLAGWAAWPATFLMTYMIDVVQLLAHLPHASVGTRINAGQLALAYSLVVVIALIWWQKSTKRSKITDRNQLVGANET